jgi:Spy/CpxP family protein refolding chaperone
MQVVPLKQTQNKNKEWRGMKNTLFSGLAIATLLVAGVATVMAQAPDGTPAMGPHRPPMERAMGIRGDHGRWWNDARAIDKYKLSESQRKAMDDIYQQHRLGLVDLHGALQKEELTMEPLIRADQPDENKILAQIDRVAQARAELEKANARMLFEIRRQLTPEQWKLVQADRTQRREHEGVGPEGRPAWRRQGDPGQGAPPPSGGPGPDAQTGPGEDE